MYMTFIRVQKYNIKQPTVAAFIFQLLSLQLFFISERLIIYLEILFNKITISCQQKLSAEHHKITKLEKISAVITSLQCLLYYLCLLIGNHLTESKSSCRKKYINAQRTHQRYTRPEKIFWGNTNPISGRSKPEIKPTTKSVSSHTSITHFRQI